MGRQRQTYVDRFENKFTPGPISGCWLWHGPTNSNGYGLFYVNNNRLSAHRAAWMIYKGPIPPGDGYHGTCVLHKCDVRNCVNPDHLFLGTQKDNILDAVKKGRIAVPDSGYCFSRGEKNPAAVLTEKQVLEIRERKAERGVDLAKEYSVSTSAISAARTGEKWGWLAA